MENFDEVELQFFMTPRELNLSKQMPAAEESNGRWDLIEGWLKDVLGQIGVIGNEFKEYRKEVRDEIRSLQVENSEIRIELRSLKNHEAGHSQRWSTVTVILTTIFTGIVCSGFAALIAWLVAKK